MTIPAREALIKECDVLFGSITPSTPKFLHRPAVLESIGEKWPQIRALLEAQPPAGAERGLPDDLFSHEDAWRAAIEEMRDNAPSKTEDGNDDRSYWQHELDVFNRTWALLRSPAGAGKVTDIQLEAYDAGYLPSASASVEWWQDYVRAELGRAHDFYQGQLDSAAAQRPMDGEAQK